METKRRKLLLADDSITIQKVVTLTFSDEGMDVLAVGSGDRAIRELEESGPPDIVLADVHMPGLGGYEVCERIKRDARWRHVPVILLAGAFEPFDEAEARRVGADEVLSKPFQSIRDLIGKVGSLLGGAKPDEAAREKSHAAQDEAHGRSAAAGRVDASAHDAADARAGSSAGAQAVALDEKPAPFADLGMDDEMIEATPAEAFGSAAERPRASATAEGSLVSEDVEESGAWAVEGRDTQAVAAAAATQEVGAESFASRPAFAARAASAAAADEALLDLGGIEPPPSVSEADDFILDLDFDETPPPRPRASDVRTDTHAYAGRESAPQSRVDAAGAFAEAAHGAGAEGSRADAPFAREFAAWRGEMEESSPAPRAFVEPQVVPSEEGARASEDLSVEGDLARPPLEAVAHDAAAQAVPSAVGPAAREQGIDPQQLSPEVIDAIARRAVEMLSERVVREIAWEVVPELAERLIKQRLDQQK